MNENQDYMEKTDYHLEAITHESKFTGVAICKHETQYHGRWMQKKIYQAKVN